MKITGSTLLYGVIGNPISHSLSPVMHNAVMEHLGINCIYIPLLVPSPEDIESALKGLHALNFRGINITVPYKETIIPFIDRLSDRATKVGSVNTIIVHDRGKLMGFNTDGQGFAYALAEDLDFTCEGKNVLFLGYGGSGKAVVMEAAMNKAKTITIAGKNIEKAMALANRVRQFYPEVIINTFTLNDPQLKQKVQSADLLVNTTPIGMKPGDELLIPPDWLRPELKIYDLIYNPPVTPLLKAAQEIGCQTANGLSMLVAQGAASFKIWFNIEPPVHLMKQALVEYIANHTHQS